MNLLELQTRANLVVEKVNAYEAKLSETSINETEVLAEHKYADLFCLRPVLKLLLGDTVDKKVSRTLSNDVDLPVIASSAPMWNTKFNFFNTAESYQSDHHEFMNSLDVYNNNNLIMLDQKQSTLTSREDRIRQGINYAYSSNIKDALVTESQLANVFAWNTTDKRGIANNIQTTHRQVPGIVLYYLGNGYDNSYTATIGCNESDELNSVQYSHPVTYGSWYANVPVTGTGYVEESTSQLPWLPEEGGSCCRIFIPGCNYTRGKLESPQQIWQPDRNSNQGIKYQGKAIYHELVFKNRRSGCTDYNLDFTSGVADIPDNDPQGLATRLALSKQKDYYFNRPWFNELDTENKLNSSKLADAIEENSLNKYQTYALDTKNWTIPTARQNDFDPNTGTFYVAGYGETENDSIKCVSNITLTNYDYESTSPHTNYATLCFWIDPTTVRESNNDSHAIFCQVNTNSRAGLVIYKELTGGVTFGFSSGTSGTFSAEAWNKTKYCLCVVSTYGRRILARLTCYDENKQYIDAQTRAADETYNYNSKALTCTFGSANYYGIYHSPKLKIGITDLGIPLAIVDSGIPFTGKPGDLHEVILTDNLDSYTSTVITTDHSDVLTDEGFYNNYKLDWNTYAQTYNLPR